MTAILIHTAFVIISLSLFILYILHLSKHPQTHIKLQFLNFCFMFHTTKYDLVHTEYDVMGKCDCCGNRSIKNIKLSFFAVKCPDQFVKNSVVLYKRKRICKTCHVFVSMILKSENLYDKQFDIFNNTGYLTNPLFQISDDYKYIPRDITTRFIELLKG